MLKIIRPQTNILEELGQCRIHAIVLVSSLGIPFQGAVRTRSVVSIPSECVSFS